MDMKSIYKKINVDNIKTKLPPIPHMPKLPKIKSRKIFKTSREDLSTQGAIVAQPGQGLAPPGLPPSSFIDRSPARISTVASLKEGYSRSSYGIGRQSSIELDDEHDEYGEGAAKRDDPAQGRKSTDLSALSERISKHYKEFSEFKFKNLFGKKTVVKKTEIQVDIYAQRYREELALEQEEERRYYERQREVDYNIQFKESRRISNASISPPDSIISGVPSPIREELGELYSLDAPRARRKKIAQGDEPRTATSRLSRWRFGSLVSDSVEDVQPPDSTTSPPAKPNESTLWSRMSMKPKEKSQEDTEEQSKDKWSMKNFKLRSYSRDDEGKEDEGRSSMWRMKSGKAKHSEESDNDRVWKIRTLMPKPVTSKEAAAQSEAGSRKIWNMSSMKRKQKSSTDDEDEYSDARTASKGSGWGLNESPKAPGKSNLLNLWKMKSLNLRSRSTAAIDEIGQSGNEENNKELNILRIWKKSMKKTRRTASAENVSEVENENTANPTKTEQLMERLKSIRGSKKCITVDEAIRDNKKLTHLERFENARDKAKQKVTNQMQKMHFFQDKSKQKDSQDSAKDREEEEEEDDEVHNKSSFIRNEPVDECDENIEEINRSPAAIWASEQNFAQSFESDDFGTMPTIMIHQESNGDNEPTLYVSMVGRVQPKIFESPELSDDSPLSQVTVKCLQRPKVSPKEQSMSPIPQRASPPSISDEASPAKPPRVIESAWIPNKQIISDFLASPPLSKSSRGHSRKPSMDSNDSDSWIPDNFKKTSPLTLKKIDEKPWRARSPISPLKEYGPPPPNDHRGSVDIFMGNGANFEDFDDELIDAPVLTITEEPREEQPYEPMKAPVKVQEKPEPIAKPEPIKMATKVQEKQEIVMISQIAAAFNESEETLGSSEDEQDDQPPSAAPSPPPSFSPPPPPIPIRKTPPKFPERTDSMRNLPRPIIKQASLRRQFSEHASNMNFGSVNKLISRFETQPSSSSSSDSSIPTEKENDNAEKIEVVAVIEPKTAPIPIPPPKTAANELCEEPKIRPQQEPPLTHSARFKQRMAKNNNNNNNPPADENRNLPSPPPPPTTAPPPLPKKSMTLATPREDDTFYSFDSDEETDNKFYSLGETGVMTTRRSYVIEF